MSDKWIVVEDYLNGGTISVPRKELVVRVGVHAVVSDGQGVLAIRSINQGLYDLPGGELETDESVEQCLVRETNEETGLEVRPGRLLSVAEKFVLFGPGYPPWHMLRLYYQATVVGGELIEHGNGQDSFGASFVPFRTIKDVTVISGLGVLEAIRAL